MSIARAQPPPRAIVGFERVKRRLHQKRHGLTRLSRAERPPELNPRAFENPLLRIIQKPLQGLLHRPVAEIEGRPQVMKYLAADVGSDGGGEQG